MGDGLSRRLWLLESGALCAEARRRTGLEDFGDPPIEPALSNLANSLERQADLHPMGRFGTPEEVARMVVWLCTEDAGFITGHSLLIDGGYTAQ